MRPDPSVLARIREEFMEMPGLQLTRRQAQRLWHLDEAVCRDVIASLEAEGFLRRAGHGTFMRGDVWHVESDNW